MQTTSILRYGALLAVLAAAACSPENNTKSAKPNPEEIELLTQAQGIFQPLPSFEEANKEHHLNDDQVKLGQQLWYDTRLSLGNDISCNTCHLLTTHGVDNKPTSPGHNGAPGVRNSPTVLNAFLLKTQFWDGRAPNIEEQAKHPIINPIEMAMPNHEEVERKIAAIPGYVKQFQSAYAQNGGKVSINNIAHALGAFQRTLLTPSRWDSYLKGDTNALNEQEKRGIKSFINNGCVACHSGVTLGGDLFQKFGLVKGPYWDLIHSKNRDEGVFDITKKEEDRFVFRVAGLRNVGKTAPYFHNGSIADLGEAVSIMGEAQLGKTLSKQDVDDIVAFLHSTTGEVPKEALQVPKLPE
ncbi:cytochrome-c peroxidase [Conchiformibius steedae]|uniref:Cytochrome-c peroxidase n=1 Tax=Conchiformibius steedae TaxID=153493 RepID=A0A3P2A0G7_9NEIS|nr:cytochrome-c peroxidase [Conchiformibius steedae]RRD88891.1 cytochrome-c peroxidase [Conchiformibius steedae]